MNGPVSFLKDQLVTASDIDGDCAARIVDASDFDKPTHH